jgi:Ribbon-helix-helix protein, copG family
MNFSIHLDNATQARLDAVVQSSKRPRSAIVREAVLAWLDKGQAAQPDNGWGPQMQEFFDQQSKNPDPTLQELPAFESYRSELKPYKEFSFEL